MNTIDITDPRVQKALEAIDSGEITGLVNLINKYPELVIERLHNQEEGYFRDPNLLWFVAGNGSLKNTCVRLNKLLRKAVSP